MIYFTTLTNSALTKISAALVAGTTLTMSEMAVGDGNGTTPNPTPASTGLIHEVFRGSVNQLAVNTDGQLVAELVIPIDSGGYTVREIALYDDDGDLFAIGNTPAIDKPEITENALGELVLRMIIAIDHASTINLTIDSALVTATQQWVEFNFSPAALFPGGTTGQILAKKSNADGDTEWKDPTAVNVIVDTIEETQTLAASQAVITLASVSTTGLAVYIDGIRLPKTQWTPNTATQITLSQSYPAGTLITLTQNEPSGQLQAVSVGQIIMLGLSTTPAALFGYGTWARVAEGRAIFGYTAADADFDTIGETGGSKTHSHSGSTGTAGSHNHGASTGSGGDHNHSGNTGGTALTTDQIPAHAHTQKGSSDGGGSFGYQMDYNNSAANPTTSIATSETGGGQAHAHTIESSGSHQHGISNDGTHSHSLSTGSASSLPPYFTVAMWQRTA